MITRRQYESYEQYLFHQSRKLEKRGDVLVAQYDKRKIAIGRRIRSLFSHAKGKRVLCLGARLGEEVEVFQDLGAWAIGVDLNPGNCNCRVIKADFHYLPFRVYSFDVVYTNSMDHAYELDRVVREVKRVLKPGGLLVLEVSIAKELTRGWKVEGKTHVELGNYESLIWDKPEEVVWKFLRWGSLVLSRRRFGFLGSVIRMNDDSKSSYKASS